MNKIVLNLLEATITLYPADPSGAPILAQPIWTGVHAENLQVAERWIQQKTRPTGAPYPRTHNLIPEYAIRMDRVWALQLSDLLGFKPQWSNYVLDVVWQEGESGEWHRRTYYAVTINSRSLENRAIDGGFTDDQAFDAQYYTPASGTGAIPPIANTLPYTVWWTGNDGPLLLYTYDPITHDFTAVGDTAGRATVGYDGDEIFNILFDGDPAAVVQTVESDALAYDVGSPYRNANPYRAGLNGLIVRGSIVDGVPLPTELPRLDFYYGSLRVTTVTRAGLYETKFTQTGALAVAAGLFGLYAGTELEATFGAKEVAAKDVTVEDMA